MSTSTDVGGHRPIHVPDDWADHDLITFEHFCALMHVPPRTVRDWRRRRVGPAWRRLDGTGRLYMTVADLRRFVGHPTVGETANPADRSASHTNTDDNDNDRRRGDGR